MVKHWLKMHVDSAVLGTRLLTKTTILHKINNLGLCVKEKCILVV